MNKEESNLNVLLCRSKYMKEFLSIDTPSALTKVVKSAGLNKVGTRGKETMFNAKESRAILEHRKFILNKKSKNIAFWVNKGGVGKSSLSKLTSVFIASLGFKVLFIDADSQGNATDSFKLTESLGYTIDEETPVLYDVLEGVVSISDCILKVSDNLDIMPSTLNNQNIDDGQLKRFSKNPSKVFNKLIENISSDYDYIITDCGPNLGLLNCSIACSADMSLMIAHPHGFSKKGIQVTNDTMDELEESFSIKIPRKIIFNRYAKKNNLTHKVLSEIMSEWPDLLLPVIISEKQEIANAIEYDHNFFIKNSFKITSDDGTERPIDYKESPKEIALLAQSIISLPELTLSSDSSIQH